MSYTDTYSTEGAVSLNINCPYNLSAERILVVLQLLVVVLQLLLVVVVLVQLLSVVFDRLATDLAITFDEQKVIKPIRCAVIYRLITLISNP